MKKGTPLQEIYDAFFIKTEDDFTFQEDKVFQFFKAALSKSGKTIRTNLDYVMYENVKNVNFYYLDIPKDKEVSQFIFIVNGNEHEINVDKECTFKEFAEKFKSEIDIEYNVKIILKSDYPHRISVSSKNDNSKIDIKIKGFVEDDYNETDIEVSNSYDGHMVNELKYDAIQLISMFMLQESYYQKISRLNNLKSFLGTKDFNRLPEKKTDYNITKDSLKRLDEEIYRFRQEFYNY